MAYKVSGTVEDSCEIILIKESDNSIEDYQSFNAGSWELNTSDNNNRTIIARRDSDGHSKGFGGVTPIQYDIFLSINESGDLLMINDSDFLIVG